jgi:hypothetical protein
LVPDLGDDFKEEDQENDRKDNSNRLRSPRAIVGIHNRFSSKE